MRAKRAFNSPIPPLTSSFYRFSLSPLSLPINVEAIVNNFKIVALAWRHFNDCDEPKTGQTINQILLQVSAAPIRTGSNPVRKLPLSCIQATMHIPIVCKNGSRMLLTAHITLFTIQVNLNSTSLHKPRGKSMLTFVSE